MTAIYRNNTQIVKQIDINICAIEDISKTEKRKYSGALFGPNAFEIDKLVAGKMIVIFALPGAACTILSKILMLLKLKLSMRFGFAVNDPFLMNAWVREQNIGKKISMMSDGSAEFTQKVGLVFDCTRFWYSIYANAIIIEDGIVKSLDCEAPHKFEVSDAASILKKL